MHRDYTLVEYSFSSCYTWIYRSTNFLCWRQDWKYSNFTTQDTSYSEKSYFIRLITGPPYIRAFTLQTVGQCGTLLDIVCSTPLEKQSCTVYVRFVVDYFLYLGFPLVFHTRSFIHSPIHRRNYINLATYSVAKWH